MPTHSPISSVTHSVRRSKTEKSASTSPLIFALNVISITSPSYQHFLTQLAFNAHYQHFPASYLNSSCNSFFLRGRKYPRAPFLELCGPPLRRKISTVFCGNLGLIKELFLFFMGRLFCLHAAPAGRDLKINPHLSA
jgi:hypothetical protein